MQYQNIKKYITKYKIPIIIIICLFLNIAFFINYLIKINVPKQTFKEIKPLVNYNKKINYPKQKQIKK